MYACCTTRCIVIMLIVCQSVYVGFVPIQIKLIMHLVYVSVSKPEIPIIKLLSNMIKLRESVAINFFFNLCKQ